LTSHNKFESLGTKTKTVDTSILNGDQRLAFGKLVNYVRNPTDRSIYVLRGWAGTGKTFCVSLLELPFNGALSG